MLLKVTGKQAFRLSGWLCVGENQTFGTLVLMLLYFESIDENPIILACIEQKSIFFVIFHALYTTDKNFTHIKNPI